MDDLSSLDLRQVRACYSKLIAFHEGCLQDTTRGRDAQIAAARVLQSLLNDYMRTIIVTEVEADNQQTQRIIASIRRTDEN